MENIDIETTETSTPAESDADDSQLSEETTEPQKEVNWEKRFKDTQSAYTRSRQNEIKLEARLQQLEKQLTSPQGLSKSEQDELEELKYVDPEQYYHKRRALEDKQKTVSPEITQEARNKMVIVDLEQVYDDLHSVLTEDVLKYDIPPRLQFNPDGSQKDFKQFIVDAYKYVKTPKKVISSKKESEPNLTKAAGGSKPQKEAVQKDFVSQYKKLVF